MLDGCLMERGRNAPLASEQRAGEPSGAASDAPRRRCVQRYLHVHARVHARALIVVFLCAPPAFAQDRFEIQVYDSETAPPGGVGIELHANVVADGTRAPSTDGERPTQSLFHITFEPHLGVTRWCELGMYLQSAIGPDAIVDFAGAKARAKFRLPRKLAGLVGLALNLELSYVPARYESNVWGSELRPVIDLRKGRFYFSLNPIVDLDLAGAIAGHPQLQPAAKLAFDVAGGFSVGAEYYAAFGAVDSPLPWREQTQRLFAVLDWVREMASDAAIDLDLGVGYNLPGTGDKWVVKLIVGVGR